MPAREVACELLALLNARGINDVDAGVATIPIAAELGAVRGRAGEGEHGRDDITVIPQGNEREFIGVFPIDALGIPPRIRPLLFATGIKTCGDFAQLERESVEVRFGAEAIPAWRLARADDARCNTLFRPMPRELPHASLEWTDYEITDPARLLFMLNALLERVCTALDADGCGARELALEFSLANRTTHVEPVRSSRATASRQGWLRLVRNRLDTMLLPAAVMGIAIRATRIAGRESKQGDLFDRGLASADATEAAIARVIEDQGEVVVQAERSGHVLVENRVNWRQADLRRETWDLGQRQEQESQVPSPTSQVLTLQLSPVPQSITVETVARRDHMVPSRYRDTAGWHDVVNAAGPDRVSGGAWDHAHAYAREYFRCVTRDGALVWLFRNARSGRHGQWYLHGWWD